MGPASFPGSRDCCWGAQQCELGFSGAVFAFLGALTWQCGLSGPARWEGGEGRGGGPGSPLRPETKEPRGGELRVLHANCHRRPGRGGRGPAYRTRGRGTLWALGATCPQLEASVSLVLPWDRGRVSFSCSLRQRVLDGPEPEGRGGRCSMPPPSSLLSGGPTPPAAPHCVSEHPDVEHGVGASPARACRVH